MEKLDNDNYECCACKTKCFWIAKMLCSAVEPEVPESDRETRGSSREASGKSQEAFGLIGHNARKTSRVLVLRQQLTDCREGPVEKDRCSVKI